MSSINKSWQEWADENIRRGCDREEIGEILLKNNFTLPQIRELMGKNYPEALGRKKGKTASSAPDTDDFNRKCASLIDIQQRLARLSPKTNIIERRRGVSCDEFLEKYYAANRPVILCDLMTYWQAAQKWTPEYLKATCGEEMVEIMAARNSSPDYEINVEPHRKNVRFCEYVDMVMAGGETNDYYLTARNNFFSRQGVRPLLKDIEIFSEYLKETDGEGVHLWFGPKGTITTLHHDGMNIFMAQVQGRKQVKLIPANQIEMVYNHFAVYSQVDVVNPDYERFPRFRDASIIELELAPGEVLFVPVGWWHWVKALDTSIMISFTNFLFPNDFKWEHPGGAAEAAY